MTWDAERVEELLDALRANRGDTTSVEVKLASGGLPDSLATTVCAFANMPAGGTVLLGIDERAGFDPVGVDDPSGLASGIVDQARSHVKPPPHIDTYTVTVNLAHIVVAEVTALPLPERPALLRGQAYLRQADGDYVMQEHELRMIQRRQLLEIAEHQYDQQPVAGLTREDLDAAYIGLPRGGQGRRPAALHKR